MQGETLENIKDDLVCIISTGYFTFEFGFEESGKENQLLLLYEPNLAQLSPPREGFQTQRAHTLRRKGVWNSDQIGDFVRKLGFINKEKGVDQVKDFLHLSQVYHANNVIVYNRSLFHHLDPLDLVVSFSSPVTQLI